jgi:hypothetical protein
VFCYGIHAARVAYEYHLVGQLFRLQVQMEARAVGIDNQFGFWESSFVHSFFIDC